MNQLVRTPNLHRPSGVEESRRSSVAGRPSSNQSSDLRPPSSVLCPPTSDLRPPTPSVAILTGGGDRPYALGLANSLLAARVPFDFIGSDELDSPALHGNPLVRFLNLRGDQSSGASPIQKLRRVLLYYYRLLVYAVTSPAPVFHLLWNNKFEYFDRTLLLMFYRLCGKRLVFTAHNVNICKRDGGDTWLNRLTLRIQYGLVAHILVHTERMKLELTSDFGVGEDKVSVIPFGINSTVPDTDLTTVQARSALGLKPEDKVILFFGNIAPYKGLEYLVEAVAVLAEILPEVRLLIAGRLKCDPDYWAEIERRLADPNLSGRVVARIEYVPDEETEIYFKAADVLVLPYTQIFQSGILFLSYNFGLPVLVSDVGALKDHIVEGKTGFAFCPKESGDLTRCLKRFFSSDICSTFAGGREDIRSWARKRYSWTTVAEIVLKIYPA